MSKRKAGVVCAAKNCPNKGYNCNLSFFTFPRDEQRAHTWLRACGREDLLENVSKPGSYKLCAAHFEDRMYLNHLKNRLLPTALPTLFPSMECSSNTDVEHSNYLQATDPVDTILPLEVEDLQIIIPGNVCTMYNEVEVEENNESSSNETISTEAISNLSSSNLKEMFIINENVVSEYRVLEDGHLELLHDGCDQMSEVEDLLACSTSNSSGFKHTPILKKTEINTSDSSQEYYAKINYEFNDQTEYNVEDPCTSGLKVNIDQPESPSTFKSNAEKKVPQKTRKGALPSAQNITKKK
ncbi:hypothetical protein RN001_001556 [Aquatica leii]|uniref:THAP-type domain-containing protein n=1 Tax=Aquatica leii TaxID=1421715 RepID=A0AAN7SSN5_9COLE|nr:hypothetical protein RN001_001556 [Aquatica leii]